MTSKIQVINIDTIEQLKEHLFFSQPYTPGIGRYRDLCLYRGLPDVSYKLITSLQRICKDKKTILEANILDNYAKYAELEDATIKESVWRKMILGQHHGLPTRLLDWSMSPLIALHFATTEGNMDMMDLRDCAVWKIDVNKLNERLPENYKAIIEEHGQNIFSVNMLTEACRGRGVSELKQYDTDMQDDKMVILEPPSIDPRIVNQYSFFSVVPLAVNTIEDVLEHCEGVTKYIISKNLRWEIRDMLDQVNINERVVYPGLDGIATWLGRHYFVRTMNRLEIQKKDIVHMDVDAIVNSTNESFVRVGKVCEKIYETAGEQQLEEACRTFGKGSPTEAKITPGFGLKAKYIIHSVTSKFNVNETEKSLRMLEQTYLNALCLAYEKGCNSIAFPLLASGYYGCPDDDAWEVALTTCKMFQRELEEKNQRPMDIYFCVIDESGYQKGIRVLEKIGDAVDGGDLKMDID